MRSIRVAALALLIPLRLAVASEASVLTERIESAMQKEVAAGFSGAVLVAVASEIVYEKAFGIIKGIPMTTDSQFWLSSTGKQFVSAAVLKASEAGLLELDDPISFIFPDAPDDKANITLRQLLSHTSGLGQDYSTEKAPDRATALAAILALPLESEPGVGFHYSNANYQLAAAALETVTGLPYAEYLQSELLSVAGLERTGQANATEYARVAPVAFELPERLKRAQWGSQGMYSTAEDLWRWYSSLQNGHILSPESTGQLFHATVPIGEGAAALGWFEGSDERLGRFRFTRGNDDYGANSLIYDYLDQQTIIIVLTHAGEKADGLSYSRAVLHAIEQAYEPDA